MFRFCRLCFAVLIPLSGLSAPGLAQALSRADQAALIDSLAQIVRAQYVFPSVGDSAAQLLRANFARGDYAGDTSAATLAQALTRDLRNRTRDRHFAVLDPRAAQQRGLGADRRSAGEGGTMQQMMAARSEQERRLNYYFRGYERLAGNVAYLALDQFPVPDAARETAVAMMRLAANADAIILDLRANPGGVEGLNQFLSSYFIVKPDEILYQRYHRIGDTTTTIRVLPDVPGRRIPTTPLYILISARTGSAAENLAYTLQSHGRATLVGETTAGAANSSRVFPLPGGSFAQIPIARVIQPRTGTNWEGVGVVPNVRVDAAVARDTAHALALRGLIASTRDAAVSADLQRALAGLTTRAAPSSSTWSPSPADLRAFVGQYGERVITLDGNALQLKRGAGQSLKMVPAGDRDTFTLENIPDALVRFTRSGTAVIEIQSRQPDGSWQAARRTGG